MTKEELAKYAGIKFYNLSTRMGGMYGKTLCCLTVYEVTKNGTCRYCEEIIHCIGNKASWEFLN